jgi:hypothetical protein
VVKTQQGMAVTHIIPLWKRGSRYSSLWQREVACLREAASAKAGEGFSEQMLSYDKQLKALSQHLPLTPLCQRGGRERRNFAKEGERKGRNDPTIRGDQIDLEQLLGKIEKYGLQQEWKQAQKMSQE